MSLLIELLEKPENSLTLKRTNEVTITWLEEGKTVRMGSALMDKSKVNVISVQIEKFN